MFDEDRPDGWVPHSDLRAVETVDACAGLESEASRMNHKPGDVVGKKSSPPLEALTDAAPDRIERLIEAIAKCAVKRRLQEAREAARRDT